MIVGLTGLHGAGKSFLAQIMHDKIGWEVVIKRDVLRMIYEKSDPVDGLTWEEWYRVLYAKIGAYKMMCMVIDEARISERKSIVVIDSIHNTDEWRAVKHLHSEAILVGVFSPREIRQSRNTLKDVELDVKRIIYWHENVLGEFSCLLSEVEWAFSGCNPPQSQLRKCHLLKNYLNKRQLS
jgi:hypothetical protein